MTTCSACNATLGEGAKFCSECGTAAAASPIDSSIEETFNAAVEFVGNVAEETSRQVSDVLRNENAQKIAGGAAVIGAGVVAYQQMTRK